MSVGVGRVDVPLTGPIAKRGFDFVKSTQILQYLKYIELDYCHATLGDLAVFVFFNQQWIFLCFSRNHPLVLGTNNSNLPRILQIFAELFVHDVLSDDEDIRQRVISIMRQIQVNS